MENRQDRVISRRPSRIFCDKCLLGQENTFVKTSILVRLFPLFSRRVFGENGSKSAGGER